MDKSTLVLSLKDKLNSRDFLDIKDKIDAMDEKRFDKFQENLRNVKFFNTTIPLIVGIVGMFLVFPFVLGVDRLMIKDYLIALLRFVVIVILYVTMILFAGASQSLAPLWFFVLGIIVAMIVELFLVYQKAKRKNYNKIMQAIVFS